MSKTMIKAFLDSSGLTTVTDPDGNELAPRQFEGLAAARKGVRDAAAAHAQSEGVPVQLMLTEPSGSFHLLVHPDGDTEMIEGDLGAAAPAPGSGSRFAPAAHDAAAEQSRSSKHAVEPAAKEASPARAAAPAPVEQPIVEAPEEPLVTEAAPIDEPVVDVIVPEPVAEPEPLRRRRPTAADFSSTRPEPVQSPAQEGWQGAMNRSLGLGLAPGPLEVSHRAWRASAQRGLAGHRIIVFLNEKGGSGKTTSTYGTGATLGRVRGGNVLAWDANPFKGTLGDRAMQANHDLTASDLLAHIDRFATPSNAHELINYMRSQGENKFHVLASQNKASDQKVIGGEDFVQLHEVLRQFYHLILVDTGNDSAAGTWRAAVEIADELVLVGMNKEDSIKTLASTVDTLIELGFEEKLSRGVLLVTQAAIPKENRKARIAKDAERLQRIRDHFGSYVRQIVDVPYDSSLDEGDEIDFARLSMATRDAYLQATAAIVDGL